MAEIYRDTVNAGLVFDIPTATVTKTEFIRNGEVVATINGGGTVAVPYSITKYSGPFQVKWTYGLEAETHERLEDHYVVTPMFTKAELVDWDGDFSILSDTKVRYLERLCREIIETFCNQKFEYRNQSVVFTAGANGSYYSVDKVLTIDNANYTLSDDGYSVYNLDTYTSQGYNVKIPIEAEAYTLGIPASRLHRSVTLTGQFGWPSVPPQVKTAALYLAESFTCDESLWRERLIKSVRAADWRFDYSEEAFHSTGSLIADQLLDPYKRIGFAAV